MGYPIDLSSCDSHVVVHRLPGHIAVAFTDPLAYLAPPLIKAHNKATGESRRFEEFVIRRENAPALLRAQLFKKNGTRCYPDSQDTRVAFSSTVVDVAANMELLHETAEACNLILDNTGWHIRLLSKSNLLHKLIANLLIPERHHHRLIFGFSTGTLDDKVAMTIEGGTALVSKRLEALHWLQVRGLRTFGMICPSLPQDDYGVPTEGLISPWTLTILHDFPSDSGSIPAIALFPVRLFGVPTH